MKHSVIRGLGILIGVMILAGPVQAATTTLRVVSPESPVSAGTTFTVDIAISEASNLGSFQFVFSYNATILKFEKITLGSFLGSTDRVANPLGPKIDEAAGRVTFGAFTLGQGRGPSGAGTLATVTLRALGAGTSVLALRDAQLTDISGTLQPVNTESGQVTVAGSPAALPPAAAIPAPTQAALGAPVTGPTSPAPRAAAQDDQSGLFLIVSVGALLALAVIALIVLARRSQPGT